MSTMYAYYYTELKENKRITLLDYTDMTAKLQKDRTNQNPGFKSC